MRKNGTIELLRFFFSIMIVVLHSTRNNPLNSPVLNFKGGGFAVEFFFLVSGLLFAKSLDKIQDTENTGLVTARFMRRKIGGFYPEYLIAWIDSFIIRHVIKHTFVPKRLVADAVKGAGDLLLLRTVGICDVNYIKGGWYLSAMILAMFILFPLAVRNRENFFCVTAPLTVIFLSGFMMTQFHKIRSLQGWYLGSVNSGLVRGIAEICLGCICYRLSLKIASERPGRGARTLLSMVEMLCYLFVFIFAIVLVGYLKKEAFKLDFPVLLILAAGITVSFSGVSIWSRFLNNRVTSFLGGLGFPVFLGHGIVLEVMRKAGLVSGGIKSISMIIFFSLLHAGVIIILGGLLRKYIDYFKERLADAV